MTIIDRKRTHTVRANLHTFTTGGLSSDLIMRSRTFSFPVLCAILGVSIASAHQNAVASAFDGNFFHNKSFEFVSATRMSWS